MSAWWVFSMIGIAFWAQNEHTAQSTLEAIFVYALFFFYWASSVISNWVHVTVSGVFYSSNAGIWYLLFPWSVY